MLASHNAPCYLTIFVRKHFLLLKKEQADHDCPTVRETEDSPVDCKFFFAGWLFGCLGIFAPSSLAALKVHGIFSSNMVIQREKPIMIWGWAEKEEIVSVQFGEMAAETVAHKENGRWEVTFAAREASAEPHKLIIESGEDSIEMDNIVIGDVWVMNGQSNMAYMLGRGVYHRDLEIANAHLPLLREIQITPNESYTLQENLPGDKVTGWRVCTPQSVGRFSAIGYFFASRIQRTLQIPIGIISNARGGAAIESLVPRHKFADHPLAADYLQWVEQRRADFDWDEAVAKLVADWEKKAAEQRERGVPEEDLPPRPTRDDLRSWNVPGTSPNDAASCYNGMFGVFKGLNIKGVLFHQGYNNVAGECRPRRYRVLMKLMIEGWREDFNDPELPVGVIEFCAGSIIQDETNFEIWANHRHGGAYIREAQRLGLKDLDDSKNTAFLPGYDIQIPGLHPVKKKEHGVRAARWALSRIYGIRGVNWESASLISAQREEDTMVLTFDKPVYPDDRSIIPEGFAIAGQDGKFYLGHARFSLNEDQGIWTTARQYDTTRVIVWSPLVEEPAAVRYAWAGSPMGNLKVNGAPWLPLHSFRTDDWDLPESDDPAKPGHKDDRQTQRNAEELCEHRRIAEARRAVEILERLKALGHGVQEEREEK